MTFAVHGGAGNIFASSVGGRSGFLDEEVIDSLT